MPNYRKRFFYFMKWKWQSNLLGKDKMIKPCHNILYRPNSMVNYSEDSKKVLITVPVLGQFPWVLRNLGISEKGSGTHGF